MAPVLTSMHIPAPSDAFRSCHGSSTPKKTSAPEIAHRHFHRHCAPGKTATRKSAGQTHATLIGRISAPTAAVNIVNGKYPARFVV